ncbi:MAG: FeoA domain-containing protein [Anaerolineae bacterium]|nr:FeoA domain-containing protein [Anaerolineae bacterium]
MSDPLLSLVTAAALITTGMFVFWPERGIYWQFERARQMTERVLREDALKHIQNCEVQGEQPSLKSLAGALNISTNQAADVISSLHSHELISIQGTEFHLTPDGRDYALRIIRAHRIYERYLAEETGFDEVEWHTRAHRHEHQLSPEDVERLAHRLGNPIHDPHGAPIPAADGSMAYYENCTELNQLPLDTLARIVHMKDEPEAIYAQLVAEGLHIGQEVRLVESSPQRLRFWAGGNEHVLAPILAANIAVIPITGEPNKTDESPGQPLTNLKPGEDVQMVAISPRIRGAERRRLMDLGLLPGTTIKVEMESAGGNPIAYRIRGAVIALRKSQAELISVCPEVDECHDLDMQLEEQR